MHAQLVNNNNDDKEAELIIKKNAFVFKWAA